MNLQTHKVDNFVNVHPINTFFSFTICKVVLDTQNKSGHRSIAYKVNYFCGVCSSILCKHVRVLCTEHITFIAVDGGRAYYFSCRRWRQSITL